MPGLANVDSYPIIVSCRILTYFYKHEQLSSLSQSVSWPLPTNNLIQSLRIITQIANRHFVVVILIATGNASLAASDSELDHIARNSRCPSICLSRVSFYVYDLCVLVGRRRPRSQVVNRWKTIASQYESLSAVFRVASFAIRLTRSRDDLRYKYECCESVEEGEILIDGGLGRDTTREHRRFYGRSCSEDAVEYAIVKFG